MTMVVAKFQLLLLASSMATVIGIATSTGTAIANAMATSTG